MKISSSMVDSGSTIRRRSPSLSQRVEKTNSTTYVRTYSYNTVDSYSGDIQAHFEQRKGKDRRKKSRWCLLDTRSGGDRRQNQAVSCKV